MKESKNIRLAKEHYQAEAVIVWCYDHRAWQALLDFLKEQGIQDFDLVSIAGGVKSLASPAKESDRDFVLGQIATSARLHHTQKVILMNHADCGGYGGSEACGGAGEKEFAFHVLELEKAGAKVREVLPDLSVEKVIVTFKGATILD
ncbi:MAG: carbonic anhydrase [Candidatus Paceibacterota bacterium]|jgi:carbonic anhydrase